MTLDRSRRFAAVAAFALVSAPSMLVAQPGAFGGGYGPPLTVVPPPKAFATSDEHYKYLLEQAKGGTKHTITSVPRWDGLWVTAGNTHMDSFIDPPGFTGKVREGVLTPPYEKAYKERWRQQQELGEVQYDRLTHCEPPGYPRWLLEPYSHEFVNLPHESYLINDFGPGIRRVYIGQEHKNVYGTHSWYGDTIGFWDGDKLVTNTKYLLPADFTRWSPMTSNQFESVETWELKQYPGGVERLEVQVTFYDSTRSSNPSTPSTRSAAARNSKRPAIASSTGSARRATTTSSTKARRLRGCRARKGSRMRGARRCFRSCRASRAIRSTTPRCQAGKE